MPAFGYLDVDLESGERIIAENDAMSSMSAKIELKAKMNGGFFSALAMKFLGGETFNIRDFGRGWRKGRRGSQQIHQIQDHFFS